MRVVIAFAFAFAGAAAGCDRCRTRDALDQRVDEGADKDDEEADRDNFWRVRVTIIGAGEITAPDEALACASDSTTQSGACGPLLFRFKERQPPLLHAVPRAGWRFARWLATPPRRGPMPDGPYYLDGFGYSDTGELDTVTAVFEKR